MEVYFRTGQKDLNSPHDGLNSLKVPNPPSLTGLKTTASTTQLLQFPLESRLNLHWFYVPVS